MLAKLLVSRPCRLCNGVTNACLPEQCQICFDNFFIIGENISALSFSIFVGTRSTAHILEIGGVQNDMFDICYR